jgi:phage internal scaffolding protein
MATPPKFHTQYSGRVRVKSYNTLPEVTKQSHKDSTDINLIIAQHSRTGILTHLNQAEARYADVSELGDYQDALDVVHQAESDFMKMPSAARQVFGNSAARFLDAAHDPDKRHLLEEAGLIRRAPTPTPEPVSASPEPVTE